MNYDQPTAAFDGKSLKEKLGLRSPRHHMGLTTGVTF